MPERRRALTRMKRRAFITLLGGAAAWPLAARAQKPTPVVGFLGSESAAKSADLLPFFHQGLGERGFVEGQNLAIEYRWADGHNDRLPSLAADLVRREVRVIAVPATTPGALAAKAATGTIPIVILTAGDAVALGLVTSLNRPGGNITGATSLAGELAPKRLELMHELLPKATVLALLVNPTNPVLMEATTRETQAAADTLGVELYVLQARTEHEFDDIFVRLSAVRAGGLVIAVDSFFTARREQLGQLALRRRVPAIYQSRAFAEAGGVMSYGGSLADGFRLVGLYTGRILKGDKPADLPVQQTTKAELIVSLKSAEALGVGVPPTLLARADEVIE
jgi:putative tryptophan/tyrosine transport system substrate-binding protein